jgi:hypothetical protein
MLFSKMIRDPAVKYDNLMGLTVGLTFHTTKRWKCSEHNFYSNQFYESLYPQPASESMLELSLQQKLAHDDCRPGKRHTSARGYAYWTGPKNRWTFRYAGPLRDDQRWWKPFSRRPHFTYTRWRDDGPQNPPRPPISKDEHTVAFGQFRGRFREAMKSYEVQCQEYERVRSADGKGTWKR